MLVSGWSLLVGLIRGYVLAHNSMRFYYERLGTCRVITVYSRVQTARGFSFFPSFLRREVGWSGLLRGFQVSLQ